MMRLAVVFREKQIPSDDHFDRHFYILDEYYRMAMETGCELVSVITGRDCEWLASVCDGLIIPGSAKPIDPKYYGEESIDPPQRVDEYAVEKKLIDLFLEQGKPILGICHGLQALNVFFGGTIAEINYAPHQDEEKFHPITLEKDSFVYDVFGKEEANVNSYHYWAIDKLAPNFRVVARSSKDGVIEAVEDRTRHVYATQWHPEQSFRRGDPVEREFFKNFVALCEAVKGQK